MEAKMKLKGSWFIVFILLIVLMLPLRSFSQSERRIALVIGNGDYEHAPLKNPINDANDMAAALQNCDFKVMKIINADRRTMRRAIRKFGDEINKGAVGLFYYAGHGIQVDGENYLVPIGAKAYDEDEVKDECLMVSSVLRKMETAGNRLNIIILDACRDNPFGRSFRSEMRGLGKMDAPSGSILAYSTAPGSTAADGPDRNGLYTSKLLKHMLRPGLPIERIFKLVRIDVVKESDNRQIPWESSSLMGDFFFLAKRGVGVVSKRDELKPVALPKDSELSFADILQTEEAQRIDKEEWERWQLKIEKEYIEALRIDKSTYLMPKQKALAWKRFLAAVSQDNPYSRQDDIMRAQSRSRLSHWGIEKPVKKQAPLPTEDIIGTDSKITAQEDTLIAYVNGVVYDKNTGLEWIAGPDRDTSWRKAKSWVNSLGVAGGGWRMPTSQELKGLYKKGEGKRNMTPLLKISTWNVWSEETRDDSWAACISFRRGTRHWHLRILRSSRRGFAVRSRR
jgi:hypothetical protein